MACWKVDLAETAPEFPTLSIDFLPVLREAEWTTRNGSLGLIYGAHAIDDRRVIGFFLSGPYGHILT